MAKDKEIGVEGEPSRRRFIKQSLGVIAGLGVVALAGKEVGTVSEVIATDLGDFVPLYEKHDQGVSPEKIPADTDIFFLEIAFLKGGLMTRDLVELLQARLSSGPRFSPKLNSKLATYGIELMFGDVVSPWREELERIEGLELGAGLGGIIGLYLTREKGPSKPKLISRRQILRILGGGASLWAALSIPTDLLTVGTYSLTRKEAIRRIITRVDALVRHAHPEVLNMFFRNLVIADKLLMVAEDFKAKTGRKPKIAFSVGAAHGGIEDFLRVGRDFCRSLILAYPAPILKKAVEQNGGIQDFCSSRLVQLPSDLDSQMPDFKQKLADAQERIVTDYRLQQSLEAKI